jgi:hypothetical protein
MSINNYFLRMIMKKHNIILALGALILIVSMGLDSPKNFDFRPGKRLIVKGNMFEAGSATLSNQESTWLKELSAYLAKRPNLYMEIAGYTDNQGDSLANKRLSEARANAVKEYLVRNGVADARIKTLGRGSENPIASNDIDEGRGKNRRVEITATSPFTERPLTNRNNTPLAPEGRITAMLPPVRSLAPWDVDWHSAKLSEPIYEYHRLETGAKARAEITFANKHRVQIAEQSLVVLYGQAASPLAGKPSEQLRLVQGGLWVKLKSLKQSETLRISTNSGEFALGQSSAKIEVDSAKRSLVSVHTGNVTLQSTEGATGASMTVKENFGTRIAANMPPEQPRLLPPVPQLLEPLGMDSLYAGTISFLWRKTAPRTRFEVANAITFDKPLHSMTNQGDSAQVLLPEGEWYVKLAAIDSIGLESRSSIYLFRIGKPPVPQRFYALSLLLFIGAALAGWWGGLTKQPRIAWWSLAFVVAGCASFFLLHW